VDGGLEGEPVERRRRGGHRLTIHGSRSGPGDRGRRIVASWPM
jgi:hypothetical protein